MPYMKTRSHSRLSETGMNTLRSNNAPKKNILPAFDKDSKRKVNKTVKNNNMKVKKAQESPVKKISKRVKKATKNEEKPPQGDRGCVKSPVLCEVRLVRLNLENEQKSRNKTSKKQKTNEGHNKIEQKPQDQASEEENKSEQRSRDKINDEENKNDRKSRNKTIKKQNNGDKTSKERNISEQKSRGETRKKQNKNEEESHDKTRKEQNKKTVSKRNPSLNLQNSEDVTLIPKKLRSRKPVKYNESSLEVSKSKEAPNVKKVPIYNQNVDSERKASKRLGDQYEFDSDSEKYKKRKRRKLDDSDSYSETIQNILKKIANRRKFKDKKLIYTDQNVNNKQTKKPILKKDQKNNNNVAKITENVETLKKINVAVVKIPDDTGTKSDDQAPVTSVLNPVSEKVIEENLPEIENDVGYDLSDDEYFGLVENEKTSPKIKILNNIQLQSRNELNLSISSPKFFKDGQPNANSTMLNHNILTPWRFNEINIRRNPHFISLKQSSLPYINQEMILDHTTVDKLSETLKPEEENVPQVKTTPSRKTIQATIHDFFDSNKENNKENLELSLFDNDQFSPIKRDRIITRNSSVKRKILSERNENTNEFQTELPEAQQESQSDLNKTNDEYFGFDSDDENDAENVTEKAKDDRPFRLSVNQSANDKKYQRKRKVYFKGADSYQSSEESNSSNESEAEGEEAQVGIFEDFQSTRTLIDNQDEAAAYTRKLKKKNAQKQRKRKDVRTKEEEEEAEKWAEAFNSMCEEIDQFPLEIE